VAAVPVQGRLLLAGVEASAQRWVIAVISASRIWVLRLSMVRALATDLHTLQAKAYARIGDRASCHAHMSRAETSAARIRQNDEPSETGYVQPGLLECQHAEEALRSVDACHLRGQAHRLATLAFVLAERGDVDHAAATAETMLERVEGMESERVATVTAALRPFSTRTVREFLTRAGQQARVPL
jgi:hypothetical protein